jgi:glutathione peroxidase
VSNYLGLAQLFDQFAPQGLAIVGTPCAQFDNQEPGDNDEILNILRYVRPGQGFVPAFPLTQKMDVNGLTADSMWSTLRASCPSPIGIFALQYYPWTPVTSSDVSWNFEKVLLDSELRPITRYAPTAAPSSIAPDIQRLLASQL